MQPKKDEQTKKSQQEGKVQQMENELHLGTLVVMDQEWQEVANDMAKQLVLWRMVHPPMGTWMQWLSNWRCWHKKLGRMGKCKSCRRKMKGW